VIRNNNILLVKRRDPPGRDMWSVPGGVIEVGETIRDAAKRELFEETGLVAEPIGVIDVVEVIVRDEAGFVRYHYVILDVLFDDSTLEGVLRPGGDALDVKWLDLGEAVSRNDVTRSTKRLVEKILRREVSVIKI